MSVRPQPARSFGRLTPRLVFAAALVFAGAANGAERKPPDALDVLQQNPSSSASERVGLLYRESKDPDARIWLVDALFDRVRQYGDEKALSLLLDAVKDRNPSVRGKAVAALQSVRFLPQGPARDAWTSRIEAAAHATTRDSSPVVRSAGLELRRALAGWRGEGHSSEPSPPSGGELSRWIVGAMPQVFVWVVCLQLIGYAWHRMGMNLLAQLGAAGSAVLGAIAAFEKRPSLLAFPLLTGVLLLPTLGLTFAWALIAAAVPSSEPLSWSRWLWAAVGLYAASGTACFLPALFLTSRLAGRLGSAMKRLPALLLLSEFSLLIWPLVALMRRSPRHRAGKNVPAWMARIGVPLAALLATRLMVAERLGTFTALTEASKRYRSADHDPGLELLGHAPTHPAFALWCLASPVLFSFSLVPAIWLGFRPTQLFGLWFLSNTQFCVGFGWWAGALLSASAFGQLLLLGAVKGAELNLEVHR